MDKPRGVDVADGSTPKPSRGRPGRPIAGARNRSPNNNGTANPEPNPVPLPARPASARGTRVSGRYSKVIAGEQKVPGTRAFPRPPVVGAEVLASAASEPLQPAVPDDTGPLTRPLPAAHTRMIVKNVQLKAEESKISQSTDLSSVQKLMRLEMLHRIARQLTTSLDLEELMGRIFREVIEAMQAEAGSLWLIDRKRGECVCKVADGPDGGSKVVGLRIPVGSGVVGWTIQKGKSTLVSDAAKDTRWSKAADRKTGFTTRSMICAPLMLGDAVLGAVQVINKRDSNARFTQDDLSFLEDIAGYAAIALNNASLYESQQRVKDLQAILRLSEEMTSSLDRDRVLITVVNATNELINYERAVVALEDNGKAKVAAISGQAKVDPSNPETKAVSQLLEYLLGRNQELWIPDVHAHLAGEAVTPQIRDYLRSRPQILSLWVKILKDEEGVLGIMLIEADKTHFLNENQFEVLAILTAQTSIALRNAQLYHRVPLVGVWDKIAGKNGWWQSMSAPAKIASTVIIAGLITLVFLIPNPWSSVSANFTVAPGQSPRVWARVEGVVERVFVQEGDTVTAGQELVRFDTTSLEMEIAAKQFELEKAKLELASTSGQPLPNRAAEDRYRLIELELQLLQSQLQQARVTAPTDGIVVTTNIADLQGQLLRESQEIATIAGVQTVKFEVEVPETDLRFLRSTGQKVDFKVKAYRDMNFEGVITAIAPQAKDIAGAKYFVATVEVKNKHDPNGNWLLKPGMTGRAEIEIQPMTLFSRLLHSLGWL